MDQSSKPSFFGTEKDDKVLVFDLNLPSAPPTPAHDGRPVPAEEGLKGTNMQVDGAHLPLADSQHHHGMVGNNSAIAGSLGHRLWEPGPGSGLGSYIASQDELPPNYAAGDQLPPLSPLFSAWDYQEHLFGAEPGIHVPSPRADDAPEGSGLDETTTPDRVPRPFDGDVADIDGSLATLSKSSLRRPLHQQWRQQEGASEQPGPMVRDVNTQPGVGEAMHSASLDPHLRANGQQAQELSRIDDSNPFDNKGSDADALPQHVQDQQEKLEMQEVEVQEEEPGQAGAEEETDGSAAEITRRLNQANGRQALLDFCYRLLQQPSDQLPSSVAKPRRGRFHFCKGALGVDRETAANLRKVFDRLGLARFAKWYTKERRRHLNNRIQQRRHQEREQDLLHLSTTNHALQLELFSVRCQLHALRALRRQHGYLMP